MTNRLAIHLAAATMAGVVAFSSTAKADTLRLELAGQYYNEQEYIGEEETGDEYTRRHSGSTYSDEYNQGQHHGYPRPGGGRRDRFCQPAQAIEKARSFGLRRPGIERLTRHEIIISGRYHGDRAWLVIDRQSRRCRIINSRGI